jgi:beta-lactamase class A
MPEERVRWARVLADAIRRVGENTFAYVDSVRRPVSRVVVSDAVLLPFGRRLERIATSAGGTIGIAVVHARTGLHVGINATQRFPMASTVKLPISLAILQLVARGALSLDDLVPLEDSDLRPGSGILSQRFHAPGIALSVRNLLAMTLTISDNSASDVLLRLAGGPTAVAECLATLGHCDTAPSRGIGEVLAALFGVARDASGMVPTASQWPSLVAQLSPVHRGRALNAFLADSRDTTTPYAMARLMAAIVRREVISREHTDLLLDMMSRCETGSMGARLPSGAMIGHKTGTMSTIALNGHLRRVLTADVGAIALPDDRGAVALAVFILNSARSVRLQTSAIARIAVATYEELTNLTREECRP